MTNIYFHIKIGIWFLIFCIIIPSARHTKFKHTNTNNQHFNVYIVKKFKTFFCQMTVDSYKYKHIIHVIIIRKIKNLNK